MYTFFILFAFVVIPSARGTPNRFSEILLNCVDLLCHHLHIGTGCSFIHFANKLHLKETQLDRCQRIGFSFNDTDGYWNFSLLRWFYYGIAKYTMEFYTSQVLTPNFTSIIILCSSMMHINMLSLWTSRPLTVLIIIGFYKLHNCTFRVP